MVLFEHGGVYVDLDSECLKPLHKHLAVSLVLMLNHFSLTNR